MSSYPDSQQPAFIADSHPSRADRQRSVHQWCLQAFGQDESGNPRHRALRLVEEAIEAAQAVGADPKLLHQLVDHIYAKPAGEISQELGGVGVTVLALANACGLSADECEASEVERVLAMPVAHFRARNQLKNDAGFKG